MRGMFRAFIASALVLGLQGIAPMPRAEAQTTTAARPAGGAASQVTSHFTVVLPTQTADLRVQGEVFNATGTKREIETRPLEAGRAYEYTFVAEWTPNNYTVMTRARTVQFRGGGSMVVDLTAEAPTDRAKIRYVTTPDEVVDAMINLAGVTKSDVVFEPGCGDARITIAAVRAGARRGVGVDIDAVRVADSQASVKSAGLQDRVEIRLGDALDIKDLSDATVVFLYMGDEFDVLLRPLLWRDLKVGARVVSHRFTMGDWKPDQTIDMIIEDGYHYLIHLWTITPEIKARVARD